MPVRFVDVDGNISGNDNLQAGRLLYKFIIEYNWNIFRRMWEEYCCDGTGDKNHLKVDVAAANSTQ